MEIDIRLNAAAVPRKYCTWLGELETEQNGLERHIVNTVGVGAILAALISVRRM